MTPLKLEQLESRQMLSVSAHEYGGLLVVSGDSANNGLNVEGTAVAGEIRVEGIGTTTVNGAPSATFEGVASLAVLLGKGDDTCHVYEASFSGSVTVQLGRGHDHLDVYDVSASYLVVGGLGADTVHLAKSTIAHDAVFALVGSADQSLSLTPQQEDGSGVTTIGGSLVVGFGAGNDKLEAKNLQVAGWAIFEGGLGVNHFVDDGGNSFGHLLKHNFS